MNFKVHVLEHKTRVHSSSQQTFYRQSFKINIPISFDHQLLFGVLPVVQVLSPFLSVDFTLIPYASNSDFVFRCHL